MDSEDWHHNLELHFEEETFLDCTIQLVLTQWGLQHVSIPLAGSNGLDVRGVHQPPEVVGVVAAVQTQAETSAHHAHDGGDAHRVGVARVPRLQFHPCLEVIGGGDSGLHTQRTFGYCVWWCVGENIRRTASLWQVSSHCGQNPSNPHQSNTCLKQVGDAAMEEVSRR